MRIRSLCLLFCLSFVAVGAAQAPASKAIFTQAEGAVTVEPMRGSSSRAKADHLLAEGDRVAAAARARAVLKTLDGTKTEFEPNTGFIMEKHRETSAGDQVVRFDLKFGKMNVDSKEPKTEKSVYEIRAGAVLITSRGAQFTVVYNPQKLRVTVSVQKGSVVTKARGLKHEIAEGQEANFVRGYYK